MSDAHGGLRRVSAPGDNDLGADILHVDMDAFFAAVEQRDFPELRNRPLVVGALVGRSVVSSASYEARRFGVRSAMPVAQAKRLCPDAVFVPGRMERYREVSAQVMEVFRSFTPLVEVLSIDEAFLDVSGAKRLFGSASQIAFAIREKILSDLDLPCSVGAAAVKHVAKIASTLAKPSGVLVVPSADTFRFLAPLPVRMIWGIGKSSGERLADFGITSVAQLRDAPPQLLERILGFSLAQKVSALAAGLPLADDGVVSERPIEKSIGHEITFTEDLSDGDTIARELTRLADRVAFRLRKLDLHASVVSIKLRTGDFETITRSMTLDSPSQLGHRLAASGRELFARSGVLKPLRLIGLRAEKLLSEQSQMPLWDDDERWGAVERVRDQISSSFGADSVTRAESLIQAEKVTANISRLSNQAGS